MHSGSEDVFTGVPYWQGFLGEGEYTCTCTCSSWIKTSPSSCFSLSMEYVATALSHRHPFTPIPLSLPSSLSPLPHRCLSRRLSPLQVATATGGPAHCLLRPSPGRDRHASTSAGSEPACEELWLSWIVQLRPQPSGEVCAIRTHVHVTTSTHVHVHVHVYTVYMHACYTLPLATFSASIFETLSHCR